VHTGACSLVRQLVTPDVFDPATAQNKVRDFDKRLYAAYAARAVIEVLRRDAAEIRLAIKLPIIAGLVGQLFWGADGMPIAEAYLAEPSLFARRDGAPRPVDGRRAEVVRQTIAPRFGL
jgi:hypothetical protein